MKEVRIVYIVQYLAGDGTWYTSCAFDYYKPALAHYHELAEKPALSYRLVMLVDTLSVLEEARHD